MITAKNVQELRTKTGAGMMSCKKALQESNGDFEQAVDILRKQGEDVLNARQGKDASEGFIGSYLHHGKIAALVEVNCETDFVAKSEEFQSFANNLAMHVVASDPLFLDEESMDESFVMREMKIWDAQLVEQNKPEKMIAQIIKGKTKKLVGQVCLMNQEYVKDTDKSITDLLNEISMKIGEKIVIKRFVKFEIGG